MSARLTRLALGFGVAAAAGSGCDRGEVALLDGVRARVEIPAPRPIEVGGPEVVELTRVVLRREDLAEQSELFDDELAKTFGRALAGEDGFIAEAAATPPGRRRRQARAELILSAGVRDGERERPIFVAVEATLHWEDGGGGTEPTDRVMVEGTLRAGEALAGRLGGLATQAVERAADGIATRQALRGAGDAEVVAALTASPVSGEGGADGERVRWALVIAGERKLTAAMPAAGALVHSSDGEIAGAAIGALVAIGDPSAVAALTRDVDFKDHARLRAILEAVIALGGPDAVEFLEFVASGHPDPDLKARAAEGLKRGAH